MTSTTCIAAPPGSHPGLLPAEAGRQRERGGEEKKSNRVRAPGPELVQGDVFRDVNHVGSPSGFAPVLPEDGTPSLILGGGSPPEAESQLDNTRDGAKTFHPLGHSDTRTLFEFLGMNRGQRHILDVDLLIN